MKEFIVSNWISILVILALISYIVYLAFNRKWSELREFAFALMMSAERRFGDSHGKEKFEAVFDEVYDCIPEWLQRFIPPDQIRAKLQAWYDIAKDYLSDGVIDGPRQ